MMTKEAVNQMIQEQLAAKLSGNKSSATEPAGDVSKAIGEAVAQLPPPVVETAHEPIVRTLDDTDIVRLNNLLLKRRVEALTREIEDARRADADDGDSRDNIGLQQFLIEKYDIDTSTHKLSIDPAARTLTLSPL